jgi:hypothetical protein
MILPGGKAVLKPLHSKRFTKFGDVRQLRQRLECGGFSTAFESATERRSCPLEIFGQMNTEPAQLPTSRMISVI